MPPTDAAALQHIKCARLQVLIWRAAEEMAPTDVDITAYGWKKENEISIPNSETSCIAPPSILQCIACSFKATFHAQIRSVVAMQTVCLALLIVNAVLMKAVQMSTQNM